MVIFTEAKRRFIPVTPAGRSFTQSGVAFAILPANAQFPWVAGRKRLHRLLPVGDDPTAACFLQADDMPHRIVLDRLEGR